MIGTWINLCQRLQCGVDAAAGCQAEIANIDATDIFAEGHGKGDAGCIGGRGRVQADGVYLRGNGIDQYAGRAAYCVQRGGAVVASRIAQIAAIGINAAAQTDAVAVHLTASHCQAEDQCACA